MTLGPKTYTPTPASLIRLTRLFVDLAETLQDVEDNQGRRYIWSSYNGVSLFERI